MIHTDHLREYIIRPVLKKIGVYSEAAEELLLLTAAQESHLGKYLHQLNGPALGIYQMEPNTHDDIWENYLKYKQSLSDLVHGWCITSYLYDHSIASSGPKANQMAGNLYYATAMARCHYLRVPKALPSADDIEGLAAYYKEYYNTPLGAATVEEAISNYKRFV